MGSPMHNAFRVGISRDFSFLSMTPGTGDQNFKKRAESPENNSGNNSE